MSTSGANPKAWMNLFKIKGRCDVELGEMGLRCSVSFRPGALLNRHDKKASLFERVWTAFPVKKI